MSHSNFSRNYTEKISVKFLKINHTCGYWVGNETNRCGGPSVLFFSAIDTSTNERKMASLCDSHKWIFDEYGEAREPMRVTQEEFEAYKVLQE